MASAGIQWQRTETVVKRFPYLKPALSLLPLAGLEAILQRIKLILHLATDGGSWRAGSLSEGPR
jgi:hypothetical protein